MVMLVRCERDGTIFKAIVEPYPREGKQSTSYTQTGDCFIECPTCARRYFKDDEHDGKFHSDRLLTVLNQERTYQTYKGWKRALKETYKVVRIEGDSDIANAFFGSYGVGEWDGEKGFVLQ